jgi:PKD repeat protein
VKMHRRWLPPLVAAALATVGLAVPAHAATAPDQTYNAVADAYTKEAAPTTAEGTADPASCFVNDDVGTRQQCHLRFTVTGLGEGDSVTGAELRIVDKGSATGSKLVNASTSTGAWDESTVTWNTRPTTGTTVGSQTSHVFGADSVFALAAGTVTSNGTYDFVLWSPANSYSTGMNFFPSGVTGRAPPRLVLHVDHQSPPVASVVASPSTGVAPLTVTLDASGSTDPDGDIASYTFDPWDGSDPVTQTSPTLTHVYTVPGTYTPAVDVVDSGGRHSVNFGSVTVTAPADPPSAGLVVSPTGGTVPLTVTADASSSTDPNNDIASYTFAWGDGTANTGPQAGATATHTYTAAGAYTVTVTVTDSGGRTGTATAQVNTANPPPVARFPGDPGAGKVLLGFNDISGYLNTENALPHRVAVHRVYTNATWSVPVNKIQDAIDRGQIPWVSIGYSPYGSPGAVPQSAVNSTCTTLKTFAPHPIFMVPGLHEPEDNTTGAAWNSDFRALGRNIVLTCRSMGVTNVAFTAPAWMNCTFSGGCAGRDWRSWDFDWKGTSGNGAADFYSGTAKVTDIDAMDVYVPLIGSSNWVSTATQLDNMLGKFADRGRPANPVGIAEWGIKSDVGGDLTLGPTQLANGYSALLARNGVVGSLWDNGGDSFNPGPAPASDPDTADAGTTGQRFDTLVTLVNDARTVNAT